MIVNTGVSPVHIVIVGEAVPFTRRFPTGGALTLTVTGTVVSLQV